MNETFTDVVCEKGGVRYANSVIARNMYQLNGKVNIRYTLGTNAHVKARLSELNYGALAHWMAIQFDENNYSVFFGSMECQNGSKAIPIDKFRFGEIGRILINNKRHYIDFGYYKNKPVACSAD